MTHDEIKYLLCGITEGEWEAIDKDVVSSELSDKLGEDGCNVVVCSRCDKMFDTKFIAAAPSIVRQLLEENEELKRISLEAMTKWVKAEEALKRIASDESREEGRQTMEADDKIADLESQRESLYASIDLLQDRVKDLEKKILRLEVVNPAEFNRGLAHAVELAEQMQNNTTTGTIEWMQGRDDALEEIKNRLAEASENTENSSAREDDYQRIITEVLKLNPLPACKYGDQLEPPWEVIKRARLHLEKLEAVRELAEDIGECECYDEYGKRLMSSPCKYCRLQQALAEVQND